MVRIIEFLNIILLLNFVGTENKNDTMLREFDEKMKLFQHFKATFGREYPDDESEQIGFLNFVNNLAEVNRLNKEHHTRILAYELNRYADLNPEVINEKYGIKMIPYDNMENGHKAALQREQKHKFIEDMHLYDLDDVEDLYKDWAKKWEKATNSTKKSKDHQNQMDNQVKYYRFVKTVVEINRKKFAGGDVDLDKDADQVREPNQYFYG